MNGGGSRSGATTLRVPGSWTVQAPGVVTDLAVMENDPATCALRVAKVMPGITADAVLAETGFHLDGAADAREVAPPTQEDLRVLRQEVDPAGVYLKAEDAVSGSRR